MEKEAKVEWEPSIGIQNVIKRVGELSRPSAPKSFGDKYDFPSTSDIVSQELGNWLMKLSSWKSYALKILALSDLKRIIIDDSYDSMISKKYYELTKTDGKVTKDYVIGCLLSEDENFKKLKIGLVEQKAEVETLKHIIDIYTVQLDAISREISRRGQEIKSIGQGL
jgi:hypothetical protein